MKPSIPKGTRDFLPQQVAKRKYIFNAIESVFQKYGYVPIETPVMENLSTLTGKYGEEGDKLLFKILNNGDYLSKADPKALEEKNSAALISSISKRGMRYDLTVPFARYVVMHQNDIQFPFKRYQIQPVWRADRPQKGRYNEFYQCDVDVVGSDSLIYEAELIHIFDEVYHELGIKATISLNNRKVLQGLAEVHGVGDKFVAMTMAIDKLDKIGPEKVIQELEKGGISADQGKQILEALKIDTLDGLDALMGENEVGQKGIEELRAFHTYFDVKSTKNAVKLDVSLARGLNYYTGCIMEVASNEVSIGSIGGGGRYDDLTGVFGLKGVSGVGISFGAARMYDVMEELNLFPDSIQINPSILFTAFDQESLEYGFVQCMALRDEGIAADIYPSPAKMKKQMNYANQRGFKFVAIIGSNEVEKKVVMLKDMQAGTQEELTIEQLISKFS